MSTQLSRDVLEAFPGASVSIDDGESLRFRVSGFVCGGRILASGRWSVEVRDVRAASYEEAEELGDDDLAHDGLVIPTIKRLHDSLSQRRLPNT